MQYMLIEQQYKHFQTFGFLILPQLFGQEELQIINIEFKRGLEKAYFDNPFDGTCRHWTTMMGPETPFLLIYWRIQDFVRWPNNSMAKMSWGWVVMPIVTLAIPIGIQTTMSIRLLIATESNSPTISNRSVPKTVHCG